MRGATAEGAQAASAMQFQSTLPMRGATLQGLHCQSAHRFQSTLPMRGATPESGCSPVSLPISIHAPHAGSDISSSYCVPGSPDFNPRSPCGERPHGCYRGTRLRGISIHAPHAGSDTSIFAHFGMMFADFNPRSPCGERLLRIVRIVFVPEFQSTLPMRGATRLFAYAKRGRRDFNPRSPCGERQ